MIEHPAMSRRRFGRMIMRRAGGLALAGGLLDSGPNSAVAQDPPRAAAKDGELPGRIFVASTLRGDLLRGIVSVDPNTGAWEKITDRYGREKQKALYEASFA